MTFKGEEKEQREAQTFLGNAFGISLFLVAIILVGQFNSFICDLADSQCCDTFYDWGTVGVIGDWTAFGIVMCGIGLIAQLAWW
ncbi:MAG: hypothetical protein R3E08_06435 [Thiotrichaceae bacterium]